MCWRHVLLLVAAACLQLPLCSAFCCDVSHEQLPEPQHLLNLLKTWIRPCHSLVTQDIVTRGGKFVLLYKRPGHRVIVNTAGQMMVSPLSIEASVQQNTDIYQMLPIPCLESNDFCTYSTGRTDSQCLLACMSANKALQVVASALMHPKKPFFCKFAIWVNANAGQSMDQHFLTSYTHAILSVILAQFSSRGFAAGVKGIVSLAEASPFLKVTCIQLKPCQLATLSCT